MLRFIQSLIIFLLFSSNVYSIVIYPNSYTGTNFAGNVLFKNEDGTDRKFASPSEVCNVVIDQSTNDSDPGYYVLDQQLDTYCILDYYQWSTYYQELYFVDANETAGLAFPDWSDCLWVDGTTKSCQSSYPIDFDTYICTTENNDIFTNVTHNVCYPPPPCVGYDACYSYDYSQNDCATKKSQAENDPFIDYKEDPFIYVDDYNHSLNCSKITSNRTVNTSDVAPSNVYNPNPLITTPSSAGGSTSSTGGGATTNDPTGGGGSYSGGTGSGDSTNSGNGNLLTSIDDSKIINALDNQTSMLNEQLNTVISDNVSNTTSLNSNLSNIDNSIRAQTETLNNNLNEVRKAIADTDNDVVIVDAINKQIQTTEDVIDAINNLNQANNSTNTPVTNNDTAQLTDNSAKIDSFNTALQNAPVVQALNNIANIVTLDPPICPVLSVDLTGTLLNKSLSTNLHCTVYDSIKTPLGVVMTAMWTFLAFRIFASA